MASLQEHLVAESLRRLDVLDQRDELSRVEVIVVDDGSIDRTPAVLELSWTTHNKAESTKISWTFVRDKSNRGKGGDVRTAIAKRTCEVTVIHDLEYDPKDLLRMVAIFSQHGADAVFGSRFAGGEARRALLCRHQLSNKLLTFLCNLVSNLNLTDVCGLATCSTIAICQNDREDPANGIRHNHALVDLKIIKTHGASQPIPRTICRATTRCCSGPPSTLSHECGSVRADERSGHSPSG